MAAWLSYLWYELVYWVTFFGLTVWFSMRVRGRQNIPLRGPVLLIANHQSFMDPNLVGLSSPRHLSYLARKTLFKNRLLGAFIRSVGAVPVDQEGVAKEGLKAILEQLQAGRAVIVFPEGERTHDGAMQQLKPGILLLIRRAQAPIVPLGIAGAVDAWPRWQRFPVPAPLFLPATRRTVAVSVGPPLDAKHYAAMDRQQALRELFQALQVQQEKAERLRRK
jgi:1-acyl-sn-glycerol-3-phosphate acyltransferase